MHQYRNAPPEFRLRTILEGTQAGTWEWNVQTGQTFFNERWAEMIGYRLDELEPVSIDTWLKFAHPDDLKRSNAKLQAHFEGAIPFYECEARLRHRDGSWLWVRDYGRIVTRTADGQPEWVSGTHIDISELKQREAELARARDELSAMIEKTPAVIYQYQRDADGHGYCPYASPGLQNIHGLSPESVRDDASAIFARIHPDDRRHVQNSIERSASECTLWRCEYRTVVDGITRWVLGQANPEPLDDGRTIWHGVLTDISIQKSLEQELKASRDRLDRAQRIARLGHWQANMDTGELYWSDIAFEVFGIDPETCTPSVESFRQCVHPADLARIEASEKQAEHTGLHDVEHRIIRPDGSVRWVHEVADYTMNNGQRLLTGTVRDITEQKEVELELWRQSYTDPLTHAYNRRFFMDTLEREFARFRRKGHPASIVTLDLDHFKHINDTYGHAGGDAVLTSTVTAIHARLRTQDVLGRLGGEEFAVLLPDTDAEQACHCAESLRELIEAQTFHHDIGSFNCTASFGVAEFRAQDKAPDMALSRADQALYAAKAAGRNRIRRSKDCD